jgi:hypothetical protein
MDLLKAFHIQLKKSKIKTINNGKFNSFIEGFTRKSGNQIGNFKIIRHFLQSGQRME